MDFVYHLGEICSPSVYSSVFTLLGVKQNGPSEPEQPHVDNKIYCNANLTIYIPSVGGMEIGANIFICFPINM